MVILDLGNFKIGYCFDICALTFLNLCVFWALTQALRQQDLG